MSVVKEINNTVLWTCVTETLNGEVKKCKKQTNKKQIM